MIFKVLLSCAFLFLCFIPVSAQTGSDDIVQQILESNPDEIDENFDYSDLIERLTYLTRHPYNINKVSAEQLQDLVFLTPVQINSIIEHRNSNGFFIDLLELQTLESFDLETIKKLLPFVSINDNDALARLKWNDLIKKSDFDFILRVGRTLQKQQGYQIPSASGRSRYSGDQFRMFNKFKYTFGQMVSASLLTTKDAGEPFISGSRPMDFYSGNIYLKGTGSVRKIIIGDYALQFGQGLTLWSGLAFGKGALISSVARQGVGLKPYSSANENLFFRGLAATLGYKNLTFTPFLSYNKIDATLDNQFVTSLGQSGLHRTATEIKNKNALAQFIAGANVQYTNQRFSAGIITYYTAFNHTFQPGAELYRKFAFSDNNLTNTAIYYNYNWRNAYLFGELAHDIHGGLAHVNGILASLSPKVSAVILYRNYQKNYHSFFNQAIAENTTPSNEQGFYSGLTFTSGSKFTWSAYFDFFSFPWLKYGVDAPSKGYEFLSHATYSPTKKLSLSARFRYKLKQENDNILNSFNYLEAVKKYNTRIELSYAVNNYFTLRNRLEIVNYRRELQKQETGILLYQDLFYKPTRSKFSGNLRFALFDTGGFNSRVYAYENDVLYSNSVPALQNNGIRFYANGRFTVKRGIDIWVKYAITQYVNTDQVGSGLEQIDGNKKI